MTDDGDAGEVLEDSSNTLVFLVDDQVASVDETEFAIGSDDTSKVRKII